MLVDQDGWETINKPDDSGWENVPSEKKQGTLGKLWNWATTPFSAFKNITLPHQEPLKPSGSDAVIAPIGGMQRIGTGKASTRWDTESKQEAIKREQDELNPQVTQALNAGQNISSDVYNAMLSPLGIGLGAASPLLRSGKIAATALAGLSAPMIKGGVESILKPFGSSEDKQGLYDVLYGVGSLGLGGLGLKGARDIWSRSKASKGTTQSAPSDIVEEALSNPSRLNEPGYIDVESTPVVKQLTGSRREMPEFQEGTPIVPEERQITGPSIKVPEKIQERNPQLRREDVSQKEYEEGRTFVPEPELGNTPPPVIEEVIKPLVELSNKQQEAQPYKAPTVSTDLRQVEKQMKENTVSKKETRDFTDDEIKLYSNAFMDPEFIKEWVKKNKVFVPGVNTSGGIGESRPLFELKDSNFNFDTSRYRDFLVEVKGLSEKDASDYVNKLSYDIAKVAGVGEDIGDVSRFRSNPNQQGTILYANPLGPILQEAKKAFKFFMPSIDKVYDRLGPEGKVLAPAMTKFYSDMASNRGKWFSLPEYEINKLLPPLSRFTGNDPILDNVRDYLWDRMDYGKSTVNLSPVEQKVLGIVQTTLNDVGVERNIRPNLHQGPLNPDYIPQRMRSEIAEELSGAKPLEPTRKQEYLDFQTQVKQVSPQDALNRWELVTKAFKEERPGESNRGASFGPLDKAEGYGIPRSWREPGLMNILEGYVNRSARRIAYNDNFEVDPAVVGSLEKLKNRPEVMPVMQNIEGRMTPSALKWDSFQGATKASVMQTWSGVRDLVSTSVSSLQYQLPSQYIPSFISGLANISEGLKIGLEQGVIQRNKGFLESNQNSLLETENLLRSYQTFMNRGSGRSFMDQVSRAHQIGVAKYALMGDFSKELVGKGNIQTKFVLSRMLPDYQQYLRLGVLPKEALDKAAAEWVGRAAGKYDPRSIPAEMMNTDNILQFLMNMNKFNIDKMNNLHQDVVKPMLEDGNYYPLLGLLLSGLVGGSAVISLNEMISHRKSKAPSIKELSQVPESTMQDYLYLVSALADAQGTGGQAGSLFKMMMDVQHGNTPNPQIGNPLMDIIIENTKVLGNAFSAIGQEGAKPEIVVKALNDFFINFIQDLRLMENNLDLNRQNLVERTISRKPLVEESNRNRDLKVFQNLSGLEKPQAESLVSAPERNPYLNIARRELDRTIEPSEYGTKLKDELQSILGGEKTPVEMAREINSLRDSGSTSSYMPSITSLGGLTMYRYLDFIEKTQGLEARNALIRRWGLQQGLGEAKRNSLPEIRLR